MSNEQSNVVTKVVDLRHKAPDQAIHELMQAAKDGFAVTKIVTRFNHTHVYLETNAKQVSETSTKQVSTSGAVGESAKATEVVEPEATKVEPVKTTAKKTTTKTTPAKKVEQGDKDAE